MIPINVITGPSPNLSLDARHRQLAMLKTQEPVEYRHLTRDELILIVEILRTDYERLRRELDNLEGVIR